LGRVERDDHERHVHGHARAFNQDLSDWDVSKVTDMRGMFKEARGVVVRVQQRWGAADVGNKTAAVTNMESMFDTALAFNQDISGWDVSKVTNMRFMFE
jgi:surface protein